MRPETVRRAQRFVSHGVMSMKFKKPTPVSLPPLPKARHCRALGGAAGVLFTGSVLGVHAPSYTIPPPFGG